MVLLVRGGGASSNGGGGVEQQDCGAAAGWITTSITTLALKWVGVTKVYRNGDVSTQISIFVFAVYEVIILKLYIFKL